MRGHLDLQGLRQLLYKTLETHFLACKHMYHAKHPCLGTLRLGLRGGVEGTREKQTEIARQDYC